MSLDLLESWILKVSHFEHNWYTNRYGSRNAYQYVSIYYYAKNWFYTNSLQAIRHDVTYNLYFTRYIRYNESEIF